MTEIEVQLIAMRLLALSKKVSAWRNEECNDALVEESWKLVESLLDNVNARNIDKEFHERMKLLEKNINSIEARICN